MNILKKVFFIGLCLCSKIALVGATLGDTTIQDTLEQGLTGPGSNNILNTQSSGLDILDVVFAFVKTSISELLMVIVIGVFLFIGIRLIVARGNPEDFKKAMMHLVYAVIGIFIVLAAWALVTLVAGLDIG